MTNSACWVPVVVATSEFSHKASQGEKRPQRASVGAPERPGRGEEESMFRSGKGRLAAEPPHGRLHTLLNK